MPNTMIRNMVERLKPVVLWCDDRGQDFTEYALIAAFIVSAFAAVNQNVATRVSYVFTRVNANLSLAAGTSSGQGQGS